MDWRHAALTAESSLGPLVIVVAVSLLAAVLATPQRKLVAGSPALLAVPLVGLCSFLSGLPDIQHASWPSFVPAVGFSIVGVLSLPSTLSLKNRWFGLLHLATIAASAALWFICGGSISHDGP